MSGMFDGHSFCLVLTENWDIQNYNNADQQCSQQDIVDFMNATQSFMDQTDWVERYAWFGAMRNLSGVNEVCLKSSVIQ